MSAYLAIVSGAIKLFNYLAASLQQHHDELNGAKAQTVIDQAAENERLKHALDVANNPPDADDSLRNGRF